MRSSPAPSLPRRRAPASFFAVAGQAALALALLSLGAAPARAQDASTATPPTPAAATPAAPPSSLGPMSAPGAGVAAPTANTSPTAPIPATDSATRAAGSSVRANGVGAGAGSKPTAKASSGIYRSTGPGGTVRYGTTETPGSSEVTRETIRARTVSAPPLDSVTPAYRAEVADTCQLWRDRVRAWRGARDVYAREGDGGARRLSAPERARTVGRFASTERYWCRAGAAEKIQSEYRVAEARRQAAEAKAAAAAAKVIKVEQR